MMTLKNFLSFTNLVWFYEFHTHFFILISRKNTMIHKVLNLMKYFLWLLNDFTFKQFITNDINDNLWL